MDAPTVNIEQLIFIASFLLLISVAASRVSARLGVPALVLFLFLGMAAGSEGPGGIHFDDPNLARSIGVVALAIILFAGGLDTDWRSVRGGTGKALALATVGVLLTALMVGWFASMVTGFSLLEGLLLGSIVSSTDAAAVFSVLRSRGAGLRGQLKPLLELESGSNDPMAVFLTVALVGLIGSRNASMASLVWMFVQQMLIGALFGFLGGRVLVYVINRLQLEYEGLYPVLTLALLLICYSGSSLIGGNGFLAVYIAGLVLGNSVIVHKRSLVQFHDGLAWLMQITMFLTLGLLVYPSALIRVAGVGLLIAGMLMFVARPVSVFLTLSFSRMSVAEKGLLSWVGLRGAVPIILATFPLLAGIKQADMIFDIVFFIVLTSALLQGSSIPWAARKLGVDAPISKDFAPVYDLGDADCILCRLVEVRIPESSTLAGRRLAETAMPADVEIVLINRGRHLIRPEGATVLEADDVLLVIGDDAALLRLRELT